jgi:hypothetical protein
MTPLPGSQLRYCQTIRIDVKWVPRSVFRGGSEQAAENHVAATLRRHAGVENTGHVAM